VIKYLLDAATVAAAVQGRLPVVLRLSRLKPGEVAVSAVSKMQVEVALRRAPRAQPRYSRLLRDFFESVRVLDFRAEDASQLVNLAPYLPQDAGSPSAYELLLAATALSHRLTLVTDRPQRYAFVPGLEAESWAGSGVQAPY
jgi:tRNA(fMet)-specific endonuclease VapC